MENYDEVVKNNQLYTWVRSDGMANIPGLGWTSGRREMLPEDIIDIKDKYWDFYFAEGIDDSIVTCKGVDGVLFRWDFFGDDLKRYGLSAEEGKKRIYALAIEMEAEKWFGDILIRLGKLPDGGHQLFWFVAFNHLPIRRYEYLAPWTIFENTLSFGDDVNLDYIIDKYEKETNFVLSED